MNNPMVYTDPTGMEGEPHGILRNLYYDTKEMKIYASIPTNSFYFSSFGDYNFGGRGIVGKERVRDALSLFLNGRPCISICLSNSLTSVSTDSNPTTVSSSLYIRKMLENYEGYAGNLFDVSKQIMVRPGWYTDEQLTGLHQDLVMGKERSITNSDFEEIYRRGLNPFSIVNGYFNAYYNDLAGEDPGNSKFDSNREEFLKLVEEYPEGFRINGNTPIETYKDITKIPAPESTLFEEP